MKNSTIKSSLLTCCCWLVVTSSSLSMAQSEWSQWRGPKRDGWLTKGSLPPSIQEGKLQLSWELPLGPSYSGPIVGVDRVFVTETLDEKTEVVRALDLSTGKELWRHEWPGAIKVPFFAKANGDWIRSTPAYDGESLYVAGIKDVLVCIDAKTGEERWRIDFPQQTDGGVPSFGCASSPLIVGKHLYIQAGAGFCKVDKQTGKIVWRVLSDGGGMNGGAFSSPCIANIAGVTQLVVQTRSKIAGVNPEDGSVLWEQPVKAFRGMNILTPLVINDSIFTSSYGGKSHLFKIERDGNQWSVRSVWENKAEGYMSSPLLIDQHVYMHLRNRRVSCIDVETGNENWRTTPFGGYWSTVTDGEKILALDEKGELLLLNVNPKKFDLLERRKVANDSWAHVAVSQKRIFVRDLEQLSVYQWE